METCLKVTVLLAILILLATCGPLYEAPAPRPAEPTDAKDVTTVGGVAKGMTAELPVLSLDTLHDEEPPLTAENHFNVSVGSLVKFLPRKVNVRRRQRKRFQARSWTTYVRVIVLDGPHEGKQGWIDSYYLDDGLKRKRFYDTVK